MTDHAHELRRYSRKIGHPAGDVPAVMLAAADEIERLAAKLEAAESARRDDYQNWMTALDRNAELLAKLEAAEKERDTLLEACKTFVEWLAREESGLVSAGNKRDTPEGERAWRDWYNENLRLCALAQEKARSAIASATGAKGEKNE